MKYFPYLCSSGKVRRLWRETKVCILQRQTGEILILLLDLKIIILPSISVVASATWVNSEKVMDAKRLHNLIRRAGILLGETLETIHTVA